MVKAFEDIIENKPAVRSFEDLIGESQAAPAPAPEPVTGVLTEPFPVKREQRQGAWGINQELDGLFSGRTDITDLVPLDVGYDLGQVVGMADPEEQKARAANSIMYSVLFDMPNEIAFDNQDALNEQIFGKPLSPTAAWRMNQDKYKEAKTWSETIEHGLSTAGTMMMKQMAGGVKMVGEYLTLPKGERYVENVADEWLEEKGEQWVEWSNMMLEGVKQYYADHPEEAIQITPGIGYRETLREYITNPKKIVQGVIQSSPLMLEGILGAMLAPVAAAGTIITMAVPITGEVYADARDDGTEPLPAMAEAILSGTGEAVIESWTLGKKLGLVRNAKKIVSAGLPKVMWESTKAFFRGTAEEGSQEFNRNFWRWMFTDRSQLWSENVAESAAAGGPMEMVMAGGFSTAGMVIGPAVTKEDQLVRLDKIQKAVNGADLSQKHKKEIFTEIDKARTDVKKGVHITWDDVSEERKGQLERIGSQTKASMGMKEEAAADEMDAQAQRHLKAIAEEGDTARQRIAAEAQEAKIEAKPTPTAPAKEIVAPTEGVPHVTLEGEIKDPEIRELIERVGKELTEQERKGLAIQQFGEGKPFRGQYIVEEDVDSIPDLVKEHGDFWVNIKFNQAVTSDKFGRYQIIKASEFYKNYDKLKRLREVWVAEDPFEDIKDQPASSFNIESLIKGEKSSKIAIKKRTEITDPPTSKEEIEAFNIYTKLLREGKTREEAEKTAKEALKKQKIPAIPAKAESVEKLRKQMQEREEAQTDEQLSGITRKRRRSLIKETASKIKAHDIYQTEVAAAEVREREVGPGFYYVHESGRGEVEDIIGKAKGFKTKLQKMFTFDRGDVTSGRAIAWDTAVQEGLTTETEEQGTLDLSEFVQRVADSVAAREGIGGLNEAALREFEASGYPDAEMLAEKFRMLQRGSSDIEINEMITEWAERNDIPIEAVMDEFINADKMKKIAEMSEEDRDAELERLATEQILAEDQIAAQEAAVDVLEANDIQAEVRTVEEITEEDLPFEKVRDRPTGAAMTQGQREVILLALGADIETGAHEGWHLLRNRLTEADIAVLSSKYGTGIKGEEAEAAAFGRFYKEDRAPSTAIRKIFEKIKRILAKIRSALKGKGLRTVEDIFGEAAAGRITKAPTTPERVSFETSGQRLRREAEQNARIKARKARLAAQAELMPAKKKKPKKVSRARLKINIREVTPALTPELAATLEKKPTEIPGQAYVYPEPKPGRVKKAKVLLDDAFLDAQAKKVSRTMGERFGPGAARTALGLSKSFIAMSHRLEKIDPSLKYATRRYVFDAQERAINLSDDTLPMVEAWRGFTKEDKRRFQFAAWNGMNEQVYQLAEKYNAIDQLEKFRDAMDEIRRFGNELGMEIQYTKEYWPRAVKDFAGLIEFLETTEHWSPIEQALIKRKEQAGGRVLTEDEQMQVINTLMRGFRIGGVSLSRPGPARERTIDVLDKEIEDYYHKFDAGIGIYIQDMMRAGGAREFFGKTTKEIQNLKAQKSRLATSIYKASTRIGYKKPVTVEKHEEHISKRRQKLQQVTEELNKKKLQSLDDTISGKILEMHLAHRLTTAQQKEIAGMFKAIFEPKGVHGFLKHFVKASYIDTLANTEVAITQLEEMGLSFYTSKTKAVPALARAFTGRSKISLKEMTVTDINQYIQDLGFGTIGDKLLFALRLADKPSKEALGNIVIDMARELAQNPDAKFKMSMKQIFGNKADQVIEDLKSGKVTIDVRFIGFNGIADHQPIAITETSQYFARGGNARVVYMLRQFTLRRFSNLHKKIRRMMVNPAKQPVQFITASIDLMQYLAILTAFGVGKDVIRAWYDGEPFEEDDLWASVIDNLLQFLLLSKWTARKMKQEGLGAAIGAELMPPTKGIDALIKDVKNGEINKTTRSIPYVGERYYQWYGGGSERVGIVR